MLNADILAKCELCPRGCKVNRQHSRGFCGASSTAKVALVSLHQWEEPCLSARNGAGTVFFSHCTLKCLFCQNHEISMEGKGIEVSIPRLAEIFLEQQDRGAHCLDLVTPTHYVPQIIQALDIAKAQGFTLPVVYNSSGYEKIDTINMLKNYVDVYLPDFKYFKDETALAYSQAKNYVDVAKTSIESMVKQVGTPQFSPEGIMLKGVLVRHMILPWHYKESMDLLTYLWETYGNDIYLSLMSQFTPSYKALEHPKLKRKLTTFEYDKVVDHAINLGFTQCFIQAKEAATKEYIPHFNGDNVLPK